jgi:hypothetical protein
MLTKTTKLFGKTFVTPKELWSAEDGSFVARFQTEELADEYLVFKNGQKEEEQRI